MKILIVGAGGREHALAWKIAQSSLVTQVFVAPGNPGSGAEPKCANVPVSADDIPGLADFAESHGVDLTVVGPEAPLCAGIQNDFLKRGLAIFGPTAAAAQLEGSKVFTKRLLSRYGIPTGAFEVFDSPGSAEEYIRACSGPLVLKADGLAAGKGVIVCTDPDQALAAMRLIMVDRAFGDAGNLLLVEEFLEGEEASFIAFSDGKSVLPLASSQDHKAVFDDDRGPNTGGMGAYSPAPVVDAAMHAQIMDRIMIPTVRAMESEGMPYCGFLYAGLMIKDGAAKALEFNCRLGDPEAQPLLFRMNSDIVPLMTAAVAGDLAGRTIEWADEHAVCVVMASGGYPGAYAKGAPISGIDEAERIQGVKVFQAGTASKDGAIVSAGGRVLGVTAKAIGIADSIAKAYEAVSKISWTDVHYRKDIARKALNRPSS